MISFGRIAVKIVASTGVCATVVALSPTAYAVPLKTGGYNCDAGAAVAPAAGGAPVAAAAAGTPCGAPAIASSGIVGPVVPAAVPPVVPAVVPPVPAVVPPVVPPVPAGLPLGAPIPIAAPIAAAPVAVPMDMGGIAEGKEGRTVRPADAGGPTPNLPTQPGPQG
ncbi:hypothetical protein B5P44_29435 [Mycobacterium sp. CBMA 213]|uniref:hypothetical protein n=1 Tax=unclassified Mycolicibacterium TaxID=2636767 RepID=UPI00192E516D|nr:MULTISPECIES: hypothetical protein [unclassified Mycolicibacterium]MUM08894.1 hypothetical protein [Mycolicibacterium sp. CBMA 213]